MRRRYQSRFQVGRGGPARGAASRAEVEDTLEAIQDRLSPGQMFDQAVAYLRGSGGKEFMRNFGATVRDNPVPVALLGTGLAWLSCPGRDPGDPTTRRRIC